MNAAPRIDQPEPGYFFTRFVRGGPKVPARIWWSIATDPETGESLDRSPMLLAEIGGQPTDPFSLWPRVCGQAIPKAEFDFLTAQADWCSRYAPHEPAANPNQPINLAELPPIF
jgi:hypothetical protein